MFELFSKTTRKQDHPESVVFTSTVQLMDGRWIDSFNFPLNPAALDRAIKEYGLAIGLMLYQINEVPGVSMLFLKPYEITIHMNKGSRPGKAIDDAVYLAVKVMAIDELTKAPTKMTVEHWNNSQMKNFRLDEGSSLHFCEKSIGMFHKPLTKGEKADLVNLGGPAVRFAEGILKIRGIDHIFVKPYEVTVHLADAFKWTSDLEAQIVYEIAREMGEFRVVRK